MTKAPRKLGSGSYAVQLRLGPDVIAFAQTQRRRLGYFGVEDYLTGILNTAMREEMAARTREAFPDFDEDDDAPLA